MENFKIEKFDNFFNDLEDFRVHKYLYRIEGETYDSIISYLTSIKIPKRYRSYKEIIRERLRDLLNLGGLDTVFVTDGAIYVKLFIKLEVRTDEERRACGIEREILEGLKERCFKDESYKEDALWLLEFVQEENLSYERITPTEFQKIFIPVFINMMELIVIESCEIEDLKLLKGFSLFLLREVFDDLLLKISENILFHFSNQEKRAVEFMSYFSTNETIDKRGKRHKANPIFDDGTQAWNMTTIRSIMVQYKHAKQALYEKKNLLENMKKRVQENMSQINILEKEKKEKIKLLSEIDRKLENIGITLKTAQNSTAKRLRYKESAEDRVYERKSLISKLLKEEDLSLSEKRSVDKEIKDFDIKIKNKQKDMDNWYKMQKESEESLKKMEKKSDPIDKQYERIKRALAKTLARR